MQRLGWVSHHIFRSLRQSQQTYVDIEGALEREALGMPLGCHNSCRRCRGNGRALLRLGLPHIDRLYRRAWRVTLRRWCGQPRCRERSSSSPGGRLPRLPPRLARHRLCQRSDWHARALAIRTTSRQHATSHVAFGSLGAERLTAVRAPAFELDQFDQAVVTCHVITEANYKVSLAAVCEGFGIMFLPVGLGISGQAPGV